MGILDRIAGTLDELTRDDEAEAGAEVEAARGLAEAGNVAVAEERLRVLVRRMPRYAPAHLALGQLLARREAPEEAVTTLGRAVDLDGGNPAAWYALGTLLARLGRLEPARDALRRTLALALEPGLRGRANAALGRVHAQAGHWSAAARAQRKALELLGVEGEIKAEIRDLERDLGRTLARLGERDAGEWLTRAARAPGADPLLFVEAAAATPDAAVAERLLREGLAALGAGADQGPRRHLVAALAQLLARARRTDEAIALAEGAAAEAPDDGEALRAVREAYVAGGRWADATRIAAREAALGMPPSLETRVALALGAHDRGALAALAGEAVGADAAAETRALHEVLAALAAGRADEPALLSLGRLAPDREARRFLAAEGAPPPPPDGELPGTLGWAHALAAATPPLYPLAPAAGRAVEALDRPLLVAVMGEFNAGKSSLVNALCGEEVAPTGVTPTTATVNVLRFGEPAEARVLYRDGRTRSMPAPAISGFLGQLDDDGARAVRSVEIFLPLPPLRRVEIVDTPGLNSIRPEHERVARDFLEEADAIVWVFALGQAAKATERDALAFARAGGKRVLGVLNKIDRADADELDGVLKHVARSLGELLETVVPFSATRAAAARAAGKADPGLARLNTALEERFFAQALALKRATALAALERFLSAGRAAAEAAAPQEVDFAAARGALTALEGRFNSVLHGERVALRARIDEAYRRAAQEVREFVRPRSWLFGEHRATPADEEFLTELLEDAVAAALDRTRAALAAAADEPPSEPASEPAEAPPRESAAAALPPLAGARAAAVRAVDVACDRFTAYARGVIEGGAVPDFFRHHLPRLRLEVAAIRDALTRRAPDPEDALFAPLARALDDVFRRAARGLDQAELDAETRALLHRERIVRPLEQLAGALASLGARPTPDAQRR